jgi:hypothetical protein
MGGRHNLTLDDPHGWSSGYGVWRIVGSAYVEDTMASFGAPPGIGMGVEEL